MEVVHSCVEEKRRIRDCVRGVHLFIYNLDDVGALNRTFPSGDRPPLPLA
jgi:hypothetical protein